MRNLRHSALVCGCAALILATLSDSGLLADDSRPREDGSHQLILEVALFSFLPGEGPDTFDSHGHGHSSMTSTVGFGIAGNGRRFDVTIRCQAKSNRAVAVVTVEPRESDRNTKPKTHEIDLFEMQAHSIDLAQDEDGRIYRLNLMPRVEEHPAPKRFRPRGLRLDAWSFSSSPVILNDQEYLGRIGMSFGNFAYIDVAGLARVEFSLLRLKDAQPWGVLENGTLLITHEDGTTIEIGDVKNGTPQVVLQGGPYQVWVRWKESSLSAEQVQSTRQTQLIELEEKMKRGGLLMTPVQLKRFQRMLDSGRINLMSNGIRSVKPEELADPND